MNFISKINAYRKSADKADFLFWSLLVLALLPWAYFRAQQATHSDMLWLCEVLRRFFDGTPLSVGGYETNPPLSMLAYTLPVLAKSWLGLPLHYAIFIQTSTLVILSSVATYKIMAAWQTLEKQTIQAILAGYILAMTLGMSLHHGERDHLVALGLVPFVLAQITLTFNLPRAKGWMNPVFAVGAAVILLKPHHGLIPTILLAHRAIRQRRLSVVFDADFICLTLAVLGYAALIFTVFPDYAFIIFPDVVNVYLPSGMLEYAYPSMRWIGVICFALLLSASFLKIKKGEILLLLFLTSGAALSLIPYAVQKMGFYYQLAPALAFLSMAIALAVFAALRTEIKSPTIRSAAVIVLLIGISYAFAPLNIKYPDHKFFAQTPLAKLVTNCPDPQDCKFFMLNREMGIAHETAYYTGTIMASRFASPWFLRYVLDTAKNKENGIDGPLSNEDYAMYLNRYAEMVAEDLTRFKPQHLVLWYWEKIGPREDFVSLLSRNKDFAQAMKPYREKDPFHINYKDYYTGLDQVKDEVLDYAVYERKPGL